MVRLGTKTRVQVVADLGVVSTHRACLLTIAEAIKAPRAHRHPIVVRCNQKAAVQALTRVGDNLVLNPGNEGLDEGELAVVDAIRAAYRSGVSRATFEFAGNSSGDADLAAVRDAARQVSDARRGS